MDLDTVDCGSMLGANISTCGELSKKIDGGIDHKRASTLVDNIYDDGILKYNGMSRSWNKK